MVNTLKFEQVHFTIEKCLQKIHVDYVMAVSEDPDQTVPLGAVLSESALCTICLGH